MGKRFQIWGERFAILVLLGSCLVLLFWVFSLPFFTQSQGPVISPFTAISLAIIVGLRLATQHFPLWPIPGNLALLMIVGGGNLSSILMLLSAPTLYINPKSSLVFTSVFTSFGLICFSIYDALLYLRKTPNTVWIFDDILIHLAFVPGGLSLIGHLFQNPTYLSITSDPRVGVSILDMVFMLTLALATVFGNPNLFLWRFLTRGLSSQITFLILFLNQYILPLVYLLLAMPHKRMDGFGLELFIFLAGVFATLGFLVFQANGEGKMSPSTPTSSI